MRVGLHLAPGLRVGLYGGTFDPAHAGHAQVAETARRRLGLDRVIWLVTPGNPLKAAGGAAPLEARLAGAAARARGPRSVVSDAERRLGSRYTLNTVRRLKTRFPGVWFVWIMGADNLAAFHLWRDWTTLLKEIPVAVVSRPGLAMKSRFSPMARRFAAARLVSGAARRLVTATPPAWIYLTAPFNPASATALRNST